MPKPPKPLPDRLPLTRDRVVAAALALVDGGGIGALSMRAVAAALGVEAMSLYRHVSGREDLVLAVADRVLSEIEVPPPGTPWREGMRLRARAARAVFLRHPSALLLESCATMTPARLRHSDAALGLLLAGGMDPVRAYRALLLVDSYVYGFTVQELGWPHPAPGEPVAVVPVSPVEFPSFAAVMGAVMARVDARGLARSYADEFEAGLDRVLAALEDRAGEAGEAGAGEAGAGEATAGSPPRRGSGA